MRKLNQESLQQILKHVLDQTESYDIQSSEELIKQLISQLGHFEVQNY